MRLLAIGLMLVNLGLLAWQYQQRVQEHARQAVQRPSLPSNAAPLKLLSELAQLPPLQSPPADASIGAVTAEVKDDVVGADLCIDVGPFAEISARDSLRDWLRDYAAALYTRAESVRKNQFFWIYLEPSSEVSAQQNLNELHSRGIEDTMIIRRGELKNAISLGFFRSQDSVNRRLAELTDKGYKPIVVPKFETVDHYWVAARVAERYTEPPPIPPELLAKSGTSSGATVKTVACTSMRTGENADDQAARARKPLVEGLTN